MTGVLIVGGYGAFGCLIAERLARDDGSQIIIAGRCRHKAATACETLRQKIAARASIAPAALDVTTCRESDLRTIAPKIVINAAGPYHKHDYHLARCAIDAGCHYIDLADNRQFVTGITALNDAANRSSVSVISGASSVPGLSSAVVNKYAPEFATLNEIHIGISPGNHFDPGPATTASVLANIGKPFPMLIDGRRMQVYGWQNLSRQRIGALGQRWVANVDVPDLTLFPNAEPTLRTVTFKAGLEISLFHLGLWSASWLVRTGVVRSLESWSPLLRRLKSRMQFLGSDRGGMFIDMHGINAHGKQKKLSWTLVAKNGHGPYIPATASVILARKLLSDNALDSGAYPCFKRFSLADFDRAVADLAIYHTITRG